MLIHRFQADRSRRGVVLLAVLIIIVVLALAAYRYNEFTLGEFRAADSSIRYAQARAFAESGVYYAAAMLVDPTDNLDGNPWNNPQLFQNIPVPSTAKNANTGCFTILSILPPDILYQQGGGSQAFQNGVIDESGKINVNALLALDNGQGNIASQILMALPNMTADISDSIIDWLDADENQRTNGAESSYYQGLNPPYQCKDGPIDSLEELLLVKGVTAQLLFGNDRNRNGVLDKDEDDGSGQIDLGWSAYLTCYSREPNVDSTHNGRTYLNDASLPTLVQNLGNAGLNENAITFIAGYRLYGGGSASGGGSGSGGTGAAAAGGAAGAGAGGGGMAGAGGRGPTNMTGGRTGGAMTGITGGAGMAGAGGAGAGGMAGGAGAGAASASSPASVAAAVAQVQTAISNSTTSTKLTNIPTLWDLISGKVTVTVTSGNRSQSVTLPNPFADSSQQEQILPILFDKCTTSQSSDISPRINVNTASQAVLTALQAAVSSLQATDVENIVGTRPSLQGGTPADPIFSTPTWLLTRANISASTLKKLDPYITTRTQVYRVQSIGYFDKDGPTSRLEAVIDTNQGRPRIVYWRDLTELGRGFDMKDVRGSTNN